MNQIQFQLAAKICHKLAAHWFPHVNAALQEFNIITPAAQAMFIAQVGHESNSFSLLIESLNYTPTALQKKFGRRITHYQANMFGRTTGHQANQQAIANLVYGGEWGKRNLGNQLYGDGWKYRGRGLMQITGLTNYQLCGTALNLDLVAKPELLEQEPHAVRSATWFYVSKGCLLYSTDLTWVTRTITGGANGLNDRQKRQEQAYSALMGL